MFPLYIEYAVDKLVLKYSSTKVLSLSLSIKLDNHLVLHV